MGDYKFPLYSGYRYYPIQQGNGFLDILGRIGRFLFPVITSGVGNFMSSMSSKPVNNVEDLKEAAKSSLKEAGSNVISTAVQKFSQGGFGRRKKHRRIDRTYIKRRKKNRKGKARKSKSKSHKHKHRKSKSKLFNF
jgi:hypothetical protein